MTSLVKVTGAPIIPAVDTGRATYFVLITGSLKSNNNNGIVKVFSLSVFLASQWMSVSRREIFTYNRLSRLSR